MNILEIQDLCKTYGKGEAAVQALRHATFSVRKGEFIAIMLWVLWTKPLPARSGSTVRIFSQCRRKN